MSEYTLALKRVIELTGGELSLVDGVSKMTGGDIGLQHFPIFDEDYRDHLTGRIIDHYLNREIGMESVDMFQLAMRRKMNEIMPLYNKLYLSERFEFDPLKTVDIRTIVTGNVVATAEAVGNTGATSNTFSGSRSVSSDTPQTMLSGSGDYASGAADVTSRGDVTSESDESTSQSSDTTSDSDSRTSGFQAMPAELVLRYRETLLNIDMMIINDVEECFMLIWNNSDSYTKGFSL